MLRTALLNALPIVASALGRKYGVAVEIGGRDALTNGKKIILSALPADDQKAALLAYGYLDHEAGHVRLTDFTDVRSDLTAASPLKHQGPRATIHPKWPASHQLHSSHKRELEG